MTDGSRLFRVVTRCARNRDDMLVAFEDCITLEVMAFTLDELDLVELRAVRIARVADSASSEELPREQFGSQARLKLATVGDQ